MAGRGRSGEHGKGMTPKKEESDKEESDKEESEVEEVDSDEVDEGERDSDDDLQEYRGYGLGNHGRLFEDSTVAGLVYNGDIVKKYRKAHKLNAHDLAKVILWTHRARVLAGDEDIPIREFKWSDLEDLDDKLFLHPALVAAIISLSFADLRAKKGRYWRALTRFGDDGGLLNTVREKLQGIDDEAALKEAYTTALKVPGIPQTEHREHDTMRQVFDDRLYDFERKRMEDWEEERDYGDEEEEEEEEASLDSGRIVQVGGATVLDPPVSLTVVDSKKVDGESMLTVTYSPPGSSSKPVTTEVPAEQIAKRAKIDEKIVEVHAAAAAKTITEEEKIRELIKALFAGPRKPSEGSVKTTPNVIKLCADICVILKGGVEMLAKSIATELTKPGKWKEADLIKMHTDSADPKKIIKPVQTVNAVIGIQLKGVVVPVSKDVSPPLYKLKA